MRKWSVVLVAAGAVACAGKDEMPSDLREDLSMAASASPLELAPSGNTGAAVVSAQEQTAPQTRAPAPSARAPRPRPAATPRVQAAPRTAPESPSEEIEYAAAAPVPQPTENRGLDGMGEDAILTGRPQVVEAGPATGAAGGGGGGSIGTGVGTILAGIGIAVIRGGVVVGDVHCPPPRRRARGGYPMSLPNRSAGGGIATGVTVRGITVR